MARWAAVGAVVIAGSTVAFAPTAGAATLTPTSTADGGAGSLRAAIDRANASSTPTTIVLAKGATYDLASCDGEGNAEDQANASGDLDVLATQPLTIRGRGATIRQTCPHADHERVLDLRGIGAVTLDQVTITGGFVGGPSEPGVTGAGGGIRSVSPLTLDRVTVADNSAGMGAGLHSSARATIRGSTISDNTATYSAGGLLATAPTTVDRSTLARNRAENVGGMAVRGGLTMTSVTVTANEATDGVGGVYTEGPTSIDRSTIADNHTAGDVGGFGAAGFGADPGSVRVTRSTLTGNHARNGGAAAFQGIDVVIENSTITGNQATTAVGGLAPLARSKVEIRFSTITDNQAPILANLGAVDVDTSSDPSRAATVSLFATVVANPLGGGSNCGLLSGSDTSVLGPLAPTATGYAYDTDGSCGLGAAIGDVSAGPDPRLSSLANHGGPTLTRQPLRGSPLLDAVPTSDPSCTGDDQRGRVRPVGVGCDIGAVEARVHR